MKNRIKSGDALLIVDVQRDFFPEGALPVPKGDEIIPVINTWIDVYCQKNLPIFASRDWHPPNHCSFLSEGGSWPQHCIQNTPGAEFHPEIRLPLETTIIDKADVRDIESYSAFAGKSKNGSTLDEELKKRQIRRLWIVGLALDYCVMSSALDALRHGYDTHLILAGTRAITEATGKAAIEKLVNAGVFIETDAAPL